ncbi:MAG: arsenate reductase ArsC [Chitinophagaceae bacterium]|nr:arsenate reductase ArsC [Chitinophagaceae bacterium]
MKKVLFVCIENSNRSQMAQAFAQIYGQEKVQAFSAGSRPSGRINPRAVKAMQELGYDLSVHTSKSLDAIRSEAPFDVVVSMGCGDACPWMPARQHIDWSIPDPRNMDSLRFNEVRDQIGRLVRALLDSDAFLTNIPG